MATATECTYHGMTEAEELRVTLQTVASWLRNEAEGERRRASDYNAQGRHELRDAAHERAYAYDMALMFMTGATQGTGIGL